MYKYDAEGKLMNSYVYDRDTYLNLYGTTIYYDEESRISTVFHSFDYTYSSGVTYEAISYSYTYNDATGNIERLRISGDSISGTIDPVYDIFGRTETKTIDFNVNSADAFYNKLTYDYATYEGNESARVSQLKSEVRVGSSTTVLASATWNYTYDANGNITEITNASGTILNKYYYDDLGQLIREDNLGRSASFVYEYDNAGNITAKKRYAFTTGTLGSVQTTTTYTYGDSSWKDLVTNITGFGAITYDEIGNPLTVGANSDGTGRYFTWSQGRQLSEYEFNYDASTHLRVEYTYNAEGIRTSKTYYDEANIANSYRIEYLLNGSQIVSETRYNYNGGLWTEAFTLVYLYDETGSPIGYQYRTPSYAEGVYDSYFYQKNLQGDVIAVYNQSGQKLVSYTYDAWGAISMSYSNDGASTAARYNPIRYRSYYYETDTGFYYLQSRYYSPLWGRFISPDNIDVILATPSHLSDKNLFAYCDNNPIMRIDGDGEFWGTIVGTVLGAISGGINAAIQGDNIWAGIGFGALAGAVSGLAVDLSIATGGIAGVAIAAAGGAIASVIEDTANNAVNGRKNDWVEIALNATYSAATNVLSLGMGLEDGIKTGAKTIKQAFQYAGQNFVKGTIANTSGKIPKSISTRVHNAFKNTVVEFTGSILVDFSTTLLDKALRRCLRLP